MIKYNPDTTYIFYQVEKSNPNILLALHIRDGNFSYKAYGSSSPLNAPHEGDDLHPMDLPLESMYALGLLYRRILHWVNHECSIDTTLVNNTQFMTYYRVKDIG